MVEKLIALILLILLLPILILISLLILNEDGKPVFYCQSRIGKNNKEYIIYKFRTMKKDTPEVASHLLDNTSLYFTKSGPLLRKMSLDELPQLFNILRGEMTFVGPRPALHNQTDLIELRTKQGLHKLVPGITGWAQINGRDELSIIEKVEYDVFYLKHKSFLFDLKIIFLTIQKVISRSNVTH